MPYDVIGDIHGHVVPLKMLLEKMGYRHQAGAYRHPERKVLFLGDFIDGGPSQLEVLRLVRDMVEEGQAIAHLGNHEFNAIGWATRGADGEFLRPHTESNRRQHQIFLDAVGEGSDLHQGWVRWFMTLPVWIELPGLRAIHACWDPVEQAKLRPYLTPACKLDPLHMDAYFTRGHVLFDAIEILMKGPEVELPAGINFADKYKTIRTRSRIKWWHNSDKLSERLAAPPSVIQAVMDWERAGGQPAGDMPGKFVHENVPTFVGHYWLTGTPNPLSDTVACLDYSVARNGPLVAYRFDGVLPLCASKFVTHEW